MAALFLRRPATPALYPLSLHDALPISGLAIGLPGAPVAGARGEARGEELDPAQLRRRRRIERPARGDGAGDRKSTRLNSSHMSISYAVFCLKKKNNTTTTCAVHSSASA